MKTSPKLLSKLCCPVCREKLREELEHIQCEKCGKKYQVINGIPVFLEQNVPYDDLYKQIDFDKSPFGYDNRYADWRKGQINRRIVNYLKKGSVLDDGGGYGFLREFIGDENEYYNIDCSYEILRYDESNLKCLGYGEHLPFKNDVFDNVVSGDVLEHVQDKVKYLKEAYRVLKPGGVFVLNTPRVGWTNSYKNSIWFWIPYLSSIWSHVKGVKNRLVRKRRKMQIDTPDGVVDIPSDEDWLRDQLEKIGYEVLIQSRTDNHLFSFTHPFWRKFADLFISPEKYGHCVLFVCKKF